MYRHVETGQLIVKNKLNGFYTRGILAVNWLK